MFMHRATRTHWGEVVDATIRELSTSALPIGRSASTSDHIAFNKGCLVHIGWKRVDATSSINDISKTNKPAVLSRNQTHTQRRQKNMMASPGTKPLPNVVKQTWCLLQEPSPYPTSSNKPDAFSRNQAPTQRRQTNLMLSPRTKPLPNVVKQTWCLLQEPSPYPTSSNKPDAFSRYQTPSQRRQTWCLLQEPNPYLTSSNKPDAFSRNQDPTQRRQKNLLPSPETKPLPKDAAAHFTDWTIPTNTESMHSYYFLQGPVISSSLRPVAYSAPYSLSLYIYIYVVLLTWKTLFHTHTKLKRRMSEPARHIYAITWSPRFQTPLTVCTYHCWRYTHIHIHTHTVQWLRKRATNSVSRIVTC